MPIGDVGLIELEYQYTKDLAARASRRFLWRYARPSVVVVALVFVIALVRMFMGLDDLFTFALFAVPFVYGLRWFSYIRQAEQIVAEMRDPRVVVSADEQNITFRTADRISSQSWAVMKEVWQFPDLWLLFPYAARYAVYTAIPTERLTPEACEYLGNKLREHGARIISRR